MKTCQDLLICIQSVWDLDYYYFLHKWGEKVEIGHQKQARIDMESGAWRSPKALLHNQNWKSPLILSLWFQRFRQILSTHFKLALQPWRLKTWVYQSAMISARLLIWCFWQQGKSLQQLLLGCPAAEILHCLFQHKERTGNNAICIPPGSALNA